MTVARAVRPAPPQATSAPEPQTAGDATGSAASYAAKRALDLVLASALLVGLAPLLALIAALVKLDSPGPVLFQQERVGARRRRRGDRAVWELHRFRVLKFRSMRADADPALHEAYVRDFVAGRLPAVDGGVPYKLAADERVTRVGALLRATSLDELPQLANVVAGQMSLVGPRPVPPYEVAAYEPRHYERLCALPGITGLWQVKGRGQVSFEEMVRLDVEYVRRRSLALDVQLLALTLPAVLSRRGAR